MSGNRFTTYAPRGEGATLARYQSVTERVYSISGITPEGGLEKAIQDKPFRSVHIIGFLNQLLDNMEGQLHVVWDNASVHFSKAIKAFLDKERPTKHLTLYALPTYSPDFNPDEQVWNHLKNHDIIRMEFDKKNQLIKAVDEQLDRLKGMPELIRSFFKHPDVNFL